MGILPILCQYIVSKDLQCTACFMFLFIIAYTVNISTEKISISVRFPSRDTNIIRTLMKMMKISVHHMRITFIWWIEKYFDGLCKLYGDK